MFKFVSVVGRDGAEGDGGRSASAVLTGRAWAEQGLQIPGQSVELAESATYMPTVHTCTWNTKQAPTVVQDMPSHNLGPDLGPI